jgi:hypothetical protein
MKHKNKNQPAQVVKLSTVITWSCGGGEEIPAGGWRSGGGEEIPAGGWRTGGGEEIPAGGWRAGGGEEIPAGGWRAVVDMYRSKDGTCYFQFRFFPVGAYYDIDILDMPSYGRRSADLHETHRLPSERGGYKICFGDPKIIADLNTAKRWAASWSELTVKYIKEGAAFPNS